MKQVCVVTSTRADYGLLSPLIRRLSDSDLCNMRLVVTGTHLSKEYGNTIDEVEADGYSIHASIPILTEREVSVTDVMADAISGFGSYFSLHKPDMLVVLGDRYEMCAICMAAVSARIPIAHIHGGETTEGAADECFRHAITKMSFLHFTANEVYRRRVIQLGEFPQRVFNVGALGVENALNIQTFEPAQIQRDIGFDIDSKPLGVVTFHPVTLEDDTAEEQLYELLEVLAHIRGMNFIITKSNADSGGALINTDLDRYERQNAHCKVVSSLGMKKYMSILKHAACVIGNSSSGIIEAPAFGVPTINIGDRQRGRMQAKSIINCKPQREDILRAIDKALSPEFKRIAANAKNPYGSGETSKLICNKIEEFLTENKIDLKKKFYDVDFEVNE